MITRISQMHVPTPGRLAVVPDGTRANPGQYAIVSYHPLHDHHNLRGYKRGYGERHQGFYVYSFRHWMTAARVAHEITTSGRQVFQNGLAW